MKRILMGIALVPCMAFATTWYVDGTTGTDENSGTSPAEAKATIQSAIDVSTTNDTILVAPGTYAPIVATNKIIEVCSTDGAKKTIIDAKGKSHCAFFLINSVDVTLQGFTLINGYRDEYIDPGAAIVGGRMKNCIIHGCNGWAIVHACQIDNCLIYGNTATYFGVIMHSEIYNGTVINNSGRIGWDAKFCNCILRDGTIYESYGVAECCHNCCLDTLRAPEEGNFVADPHFVDAANGDYRLMADSQCIDAGDNSYVVGDADLDGSERIVNGKVDIGCYEYGSVGGPYVEKVGETNWTYMIKNGKASVGDGENAAVDKAIAGAVDVPTTLRTRPVVAIDNNALKDCTNMTSMTIPASVKTIGASAFEGCDKLADVYFEGDTMSAIGVDAFKGCNWDLIMHVPADWQGRGRTLCGYSVWRAGSSDEEKSVTLTTTNVVVQYVLNSVQPEIAVPVSGDTGFVAVITEVTSSGAVSVPIEWKANYPQYEAKFGTDFGKSLMAKSGKRDCANNEMLVWQDYVAGTDPTDANSKFTASITMVNGVPVISYSPELTAEQAALRMYKTWGKKQLGDTEWTNLTDASGETLKTYNFFKVTVEMK